MSILRISVTAVLALGLVACSSAPAPTAAPALPANPPRPAACAPETSTDLTTPDGWLNRIATAPTTVGLVVDDGRGRVVSHEASTPFPMASSVKVVHLTAYAAAVAEGRIRPDDRVPLADWERWYLPGIDQAHTAALKRLGAAPDYTVDQVVTAAIQESDNAAADWLRARLGDDALRAAAASGGWTDVDLPSFTGSTARFAMPELAPAGAARPELATVDTQLGQRLADDPGFRAEVVRRYTQQVTADPQRFLTDQERWTATTAVGTPTQLLGVYRALVAGSVPGADVAIRQLTWQGPKLGFKSGSFVNVLTLGSFVRRTDGSTAYAVVLGRDLPVLPLTSEQTAGQQAMAIQAASSSRAFDRLLCVA